MDLVTSSEKADQSERLRSVQESRLSNPWPLQSVIEQQNGLEPSAFRLDASGLDAIERKAQWNDKKIGKETPALSSRETANGEINEQPSTVR